jgi:hypothetical protein
MKAVGNIAEQGAIRRQTELVDGVDRLEICFQLP